MTDITPEATEEYIPSFEEMATDFNTMVEEFNKQMLDKGVPMLQKLFQPIWEFGIDFVTWTQYTPYFNDGDACVFNAHVHDMGLGWPDGPSVEFPGDIEEDPYELTVWNIQYMCGYATTHNGVPIAGTFEWTSWAEDVGLTAEKTKELAEICTKISDTLAAGQQFLEIMFGDHSIVKFYRTGVHERDDYSHE